jgi:hypothetical protein
MSQFKYAVKLTPDTNDGGYVVTCRDLPETISQGESTQEALTEAACRRWVGMWNWCSLERMRLSLESRISSRVRSFASPDIGSFNDARR